MPPDRSRGVSERVNCAGRLAAKSASELNENEPSRLAPELVAKLLAVTSAPSLSRWPPPPEIHDSSSLRSSCDERFEVGSEALPPNSRVVTPTVPSSSSDDTRTRPSGTSRNGLALERLRVA